MHVDHEICISIFEYEIAICSEKFSKNGLNIVKNLLQEIIRVFSLSNLKKNFPLIL